MQTTDSIFYGEVVDEAEISYAEVEEKLLLLGEKLQEHAGDLPEDLLFDTDTYSILREPARPDSDWQIRLVFVLSKYIGLDHFVPEIAGESWGGSEIFVTDQSQMSLREVMEEGRQEFDNFPFSLQMISDRADELLRELS